ncbi:putative flavin-containing monooxygenase protein [Neofusicoccum parvum UCRNP2]|uniref:Putative flavin-containing monooxygenase protein n=1 Tax=Botryosphaeria parva (strain UCR-NP2) TaxID=1287680 RepID=R1G718_BOTPV|nr:putative flavin-containing monooxygenase protein [Neofusicoccum parvum UCRNP2]
MRTILEQLKDQPSVDVLKPALDKRRPADTDGHFETNGRGANHTACTVNGSNADLEHFDSVVVGGGQAGLSTGGRLQALGVSYTILEANAEVGDNWRNRYDSTKLHTVREFSHLPFERTFPDSYPEFLTRLHLAEAYKEWAKRYNINIKLSTKLLSGSWDAGLQAWDLLVSMGASQIPFMPEYANRESFKGTVVHSVAYKSAKDWAGKRGIVIGTANTAHDVAEDMLAARLVSVTMVQRSATYVIPAEHYRETHDRVYNATNPTELADRLFFSGPSVLSKLMGTRALHAKARAEPERFDALERAGFKLDRYGDITTYILERFGGHYMDVGASAKISKGLIKMKSNAPPTGYTEDGLLFDDGSHLKADVIVFATGFVGDMRWLAGKLFGPAVFEQLDEFWGLDDEGELKGAFKPSGHPAFWYHGGALGQARYYARFIALQIKAKVLGTPLPVYNDTPPRKVGLL